MYVACPKSPVTHTFYSEHIAGTSQSYSCRILGHIGTYFTEQHGVDFYGLTTTVTLVTMSRHDRSKSNYAKCFRNFHISQSAKSVLVQHDHLENIPAQLPFYEHHLVVIVLNFRKC